jgi:predicted kinase
VGRPRLILVTGRPGSGKTTLAYALGTAIGCPVVSRDAIKEGLVASEPGFSAAIGDSLTLRAYGLFFATLELLMRGEVTTVAEAAFGHRRWAEGLQSVAELADLRVIRCQVTELQALARIRHRLAADRTREAHADGEHLAAPAAFVPLSLEAPTLNVQTSAGYDPDLGAIVAFCRAPS